MEQGRGACQNAAWYGFTMSERVLEVVIIGGGGFGREVLQWSRRATTPLHVVGFVDDDASKRGAMIHGLPVLGDVAWLIERARARPGDVGALLAVGSPKAKQAIVARLEAEAAGGVRWPTLVHESAIIGDNVQIGRGTILCPRVTITVDAQVGDFCTLNLHCTVGHDAQLANYVTLAPHCTVSGFARLREGSELGSDVAVIPAAEVGAWSVVGAGGAVAKDIPADCVAVGVPAKPRG